MPLSPKDDLIAGTSTDALLEQSPLSETKGASGPSGDETQISLVNAEFSRPLTQSGPRYERGELLGMGGMGEVWLQRDSRIGRQVACKSLRSGIASEKRFLREARVQGQLEHPAVVPVYDLGIDEDGRAFFTMKRIRGETLAHILAGLNRGDAELRRRYTQRRLLSDFARICLAIEYAHESGVIHRDLKPSNLMFGAFGETYVLDWGVAKLTRDAEIDEVSLPPSNNPQETREGELLGTPLYMAPEQLMGRQADLDQRADVYTLGVILFEILTLRALRNGTTLAQIYEAAVRHERPSTRVPVPPELDELCARAIHPDPAQRLPSAKALAEGIEQYLEGERDLSARKQQAQRLLQGAKDSLARADVEAATRIEAMRAALKALALMPEDTEAQKLLLSLVLDNSGKLPPEAEEEFSELDIQVRDQSSRVGFWIYLSWFGLFGYALWVGVMNWTVVLLLLVLASLCAAATVLVRHYPRSRVPGVVLAILSGATVAGTSGWLGPFILVPAGAAATAAFFVIHANKRERAPLIGIWALASAAPFLVELTGLVPPAYSFVNGDLVLHARVLRLPEGPTIAGLLYFSVTCLLTISVYIGIFRDKQRAAERRLFAQAWHLRKLFPPPTREHQPVPPEPLRPTSARATAVGLGSAVDVPHIRSDRQLAFCDHLRP